MTGRGRGRGKKTAGVGATSALSKPKGQGMKRGLAKSSAVATTLRLGRSFYDQPSSELAEALLGKVLVRRLPQTGEILRGTIVETEAYPGGDDAASSTYNGRRTATTEPLYMTPGTAFVYMTYGMYGMINISSQGEGSACLLRGVEPQEDYTTMQLFRQTKKSKKGEESKANAKKTPVGETGKKALKRYELANGPGKLCGAFNITKDLCNKSDLATNDDLWLEENPDSKYQDGKFIIVTAPRIGIDRAPPLSRLKPWRYFIENNLSVSSAKPSQIKKKLEDSVAALE